MSNARLMIILTVGLLALGSNLFAQTPKQGEIYGEHWDKAGSPYLIQGDITVKGLKIDPGVRVEFEGNYEFRVVYDAVFPGILDASGTKSEPIVFNKAASATGWKSLVIAASGSPVPSKLQHCDIRGAGESGLRIVNSLPVVENCDVSGNTSTTTGGGLKVTLDAVDGKELVLKNCSFSNNTSTKSGGGVYINTPDGKLTFVDCTINGNKANKDSAEGNFYGGGVYIHDATGGLTFKGLSSISGNTVYSWTNDNNRDSYCYGGGVYLYKGSVAMTNCTINGNSAKAKSTDYNDSAHAYGGGIYVYSDSLLLTNCLMTNNTLSASADHPYERGGAFFIASGTVVSMNSTVAYNQACDIYNSDGILIMRNSIVWDASGSVVSGYASIDFSDILGGWASGQDNIDDDPQFVIPPLDFSLRPTSPCIDAGDPNPIYDDEHFPPSQGTNRNDMGYTGGPDAYSTVPHPDIKVNGSNGPVYLNQGHPIGVTISLEAGDRAGTVAEWWIGVLSPNGQFWMQANPIKWVFSSAPLSAGQRSLFDLKPTKILTATPPPGVYMFFFILDGNPNGVLDNIKWFDSELVVIT